MFLCHILTEQQQQVPPEQATRTAENDDNYSDSEVENYDDSELDDIDDKINDEQPQPFQELLPLKKFYLMQKLQEFKSRLDEVNIKNNDLEIIIKFMNNISYDALISLSSTIFPVIEQQLARLFTDEV